MNAMTLVFKYVSLKLFFIPLLDVPVLPMNAPIECRTEFEIK